MYRFGLFFVVAVVSGNVLKNNPDRMLLQTQEDIIAQGYHAEVHHVTTEDGYILGMHRIPFGRNQPVHSNTRPVVFVMHGLTGASNNFIALGRENSIAYNLADAGFDVWLGNARGNINSRAHISLDPDDSEQKFQFFDFSWEQIGMIDVPTMIDYVLTFTRSEKLHYIGHSQGGTSFLVMTSMKPEYNDKILTANLLAGVGYKEYFPNTELVALARLTNILYPLALSMGLVEINSLSQLPTGDTGVRATDLCFGDIKYKSYCDMIGISEVVSDDAIEIGNGSGGASVKQFAHYGQNINSKTFRRWDYGILQNNAIYGSRTPPIFNISTITAHVTMHYTVNDYLLDERDVLNMAADMPNTVVKKVARDTFLHEDFVAAHDVRELVTVYIIDDILEAVRSTERDSGEEIDVDVPGNPDAVVDGSNAGGPTAVCMQLLVISFVATLAIIN